MSATAQYLVDVRPIVEDLGETIVLRGDVDLPTLVLGAEEFRPLEPAHLDLTLTNTGAGIVARGTVSALVEATCSRCLKQFPLPVTAQVEGFYVQHGSEGEIPEEQEYGYVSDGDVDLMEQILAALALELPFAPLHAEDCPGICPSCGADLTEGPCGCEPDYPDSPFAALKDLLPPSADSADLEEDL